MSNKKEEILNDSLNLSEIEFLGDNLGNVYKAMDIYSKQQAIAFAKYILLMDIEYDFGEEMWWNNKNTNWLTDEQLYELFLQSKKQ